MAAATSFGSLVFDPAAGTLSRDGKPVAIGTRGAALLAALVEVDGTVVAKETLMQAGWPGTIVEEGNLSVQIATLRKAMGTRPDGQDWIATVPRIGYRLLKPAAAPEEPAPTLPSLAVLPFHNLGGDPEQEYFADGVVEDIITALSRFKSFAVIARNSSFTYKGRAVDVREVARELGVRYILEGSVRRAGNKVRISAQLVDGANGAHLWAEHFDGALDDVFDFQDRITASVVAVAEPNIRRAEIERSRRERPGSADTYDLLLRALHKLAAPTPANNAEAIGLLEQVIVRDPRDAHALAQLANAYEHRYSMGWTPVSDADEVRAVDLSHAALALKTTDANVMARCGMVLILAGGNFEVGIPLVDRALAANPNDMEVVNHACVAYLVAGQYQRAAELSGRIIELSPAETVFAKTNMAVALVGLGRFEEALDWARRSLAESTTFNPTYWALIAANAQLGRMEEARQALETLRRLSPNVALSRIGPGRIMQDDHMKVGLRLAGVPEN